MRKGMPIAVTGPSGVGKRVLIEYVRNVMPECDLSVSATTRPPRDGEVDGREYHFLTREEFERRIAAGRFFEYKPYAGNLYGTPLDELEKRLAQGITVFVEVEVQGAKVFKEKMPEAHTIFISPPEPALEVLRKRIIGRGKVPDNLEERLATSVEELKEVGFFDHHIVNDDLGVAKSGMLELVQKILREYRQAA